MNRKLALELKCAYNLPFSDWREQLSIDMLEFEINKKSRSKHSIEEGFTWLEDKHFHTTQYQKWTEIQ